MNEKIVSTKTRCPKCKSSDFLIEEHWAEHFIQWECIDGKFARNEGVLEPGNPFKVRCECKKCRYTWTARGAQQIDDIVE